ncbi:MAG: universal stress protein [Alicyclobacillus sp.]|nr:universal stress protein [Alicyclobacillus sp.]
MPPRESSSGWLTHILLAADGSSGAAAAARWTAGCLQAYPGVRLTALYVTPVPPFPAETQVADPILAEEAKRIEQVRAMLADLLAECAGRWQFRAVPGVPVATICRIAEEIQADLVVLGRHGHGALQRVQRWFLGSVSSGVLHQARVPVLVVPPDSAARGLSGPTGGTDIL